VWTDPLKTKPEETRLPRLATKEVKFLGLLRRKTLFTNQHLYQQAFGQVNTSVYRFLMLKI